MFVDFQIGKEGTEESIDRFITYIPKIKEQIKKLKKTETMIKYYSLV